MSLRIYPILVFLIALTYMLPSSAMLLNPEEIMIATVVDLANDGIIRDAITLLRSMRLYGGSINNATFVVCITMRPGYQTIDPNILATFTNLGAQIAYIHEVSKPKAKTLNKFKAFELFDYLQYNHFMWLDADIVMFEDPMPYLHRHMHPGKIDCVPDFYSYMRRYPGLNDTDLMWNRTLLPDTVMIGDQQEVSHGHCNTGVLFFDSLSLQSFLSGLDAMYLPDSELFDYNNRNNIRGANPPMRRRNLLADRFVDSLLFVAIVNKLGIEVDFLPHALNYMLHFEGEISQDTTTSNVVLAHLLSSSEVYCEELNTGRFLGTEKSLKYIMMDASVQVLAAVNDAGLFQCHCNYVNEHHNEELLGFSYISRLTQPRDCMAMAGFLDASLQRPNSIALAPEVAPALSGGTAGVSRGDSGVLCEILTPAAADENRVSFIKHVDGLDYLAFWLDDSEHDFNAPSTTSPEYANTVSVQLKCQAPPEQHWVNDRWDVSGSFTALAGSPGENSSDGNIDVADRGTVQVLTLRQNLSADGSTMHLQCELLLPGLLDMLLRLGNGTMPAATSIRMDGLTMTARASAQKHVFTSTGFLFNLIDSNQTPRGMVAYENNLLLGRHIAIDIPSTGGLHRYLNKFMFTAAPGVITCCDHMATVDTISSLIVRWKGSKLVLYVSSVPQAFSLNPERYLSDLEDEIDLISVGMDVETKWVQYLRVQVERAHNERKAAIVAHLKRSAVVTTTAELEELYQDGHGISVAVIPTGVVRLVAEAAELGVAFKPRWSGPGGLYQMLMQPPPLGQMASTKSNSLSFVLLDSFHSASLHDKSLHFWFDKLTRYGLLLGPSDSVVDRNMDAVLHCAYAMGPWAEAHRKALADLTNSRYLVDKFAMEKKHVLLHTHSDTPTKLPSSPSNDQCAQSIESFSKYLQLWYIIKHK